VSPTSEAESWQTVYSKKQEKNCIKLKTSEKYTMGQFFIVGLFLRHCKFSYYDYFIHHPSVERKQKKQGGDS